MLNISVSDVMCVLSNYNWWWTSDTNTYLPAVKRTAFYRIKNSISKNTLTFIKGRKSSGKTILIYQTIRSLIESGVSPTHIVYIPFGHPVLKSYPIAEIIQAYRDNIYAVEERISNTYYFIDDVQCSSAWVDWARYICQRDRGIGARVILSGVLLPNGVELDSIERSNETVTLSALSFYEYCNIFTDDHSTSYLKGFDLMRYHTISRQEQAALISSLAPIRRHLVRYIRLGSYPKPINDGTANHTILSSLTQTLYRDIGYNYGIRKVEDLESVFLTLCYQNRQATSFEKLAKELDISRKTVEKYIGLLRQAGLIFTSNSLAIDGTPLQKDRPKIYIADTATRNAVMQKEISWSGDEMMNYGIELSAFRELSFLYGDQAHVGYCRTGPNKQIDIVVSGQKVKYFVDVHYHDKFSLTYSDPLLAYANEAKLAFVLTKSESDFGPVNGMPPHVFRIPAFAYLYILGYVSEQHARQLG